MTDLNLLAMFVMVAETSSFSEAARRLGVTKSSVSRGVAALEAELGTQLLHRTTRHVSLSTAGTALFERAAPLVTSLKSAIGSLPEQEEAPAGELRVTAPADVCAALLAEVSARFTLRFPHVRIDMRVTNQPMDLVAEGIDLALRAVSKKLEDSSMVMRKLSPIEMHLYAAPSYLARRGTPRTLEEAAEHTWATFRHAPLPREIAAKKPNISVIGDDFFFLRNAVRAGAGIGRLPTFLAMNDVTAGLLVRVVPRYVMSDGEFVLLYPRIQHLPRKVSAFRDFLLEFLEGRPLAPRS